jgi:hypothetical protein
MGFALEQIAQLNLKNSQINILEVGSYIRAGEMSVTILAGRPSMLVTAVKLPFEEEPALGRLLLRALVHLRWRLLSGRARKPRRPSIRAGS